MTISSHVFFMRKIRRKLKIEMPRPQKVSYKGEEEQLEKEGFTSKDLTKKGLLFYIFDDFFRGFYLLGCVFLDGIIVPGFRFLLPSSGFELPYVLPSSLTGLFTLYIVMLIVFLELLLVYYEIVGFRKLWRKGSLGRLEMKQA